MEQARLVQLQPGESMVFYDVMALFTLLSVDPAISFVQRKLLQDPSPQQDLHVNLIDNCLAGVLPKNTYLLFQGKHFEQVQGAAMASPISHITANLFMEEFDIKAISSAPTFWLWFRYVDVTFVI